jgi:hypothetical protein
LSPRVSPFSDFEIETDLTAKPAVQWPSALLFGYLGPKRKPFAEAERIRPQ